MKYKKKEEITNKKNHVTFTSINAALKYIKQKLDKNDQLVDDLYGI
jgi:hypothetical protein